MFTNDQITEIVASQLGTLLWSSVDTSEGAEFENFDSYYAPNEATPVLVAQLTEELKDLSVYDVDFTADFAQALKAYYEKFSEDFTGQFGHDLALTRNHHGAGFWDRGLGEAGRVLTDWAESLGELDIFHGHDSIYPEWVGKFHAE